MVMVTSTELVPLSAIVTMPTEPEIPRLFELRLNVNESADAIGAMARAAATNKTDAAIFKVVILTRCFSLRRSRPMNDLIDARHMPTPGYLRNLGLSSHLHEIERLAVDRSLKV